MGSREIETILDHAAQPIYGIIVTACEYKSASTPNPITYWQTRIGLPANGKSMIQALPTMVIAAGATIGRETDSPVLLVPTTRARAAWTPVSLTSSATRTNPRVRTKRHSQSRSGLSLTPGCDWK